MELSTLKELNVLKIPDYFISFITVQLFEKFININIYH